MLWFLSSFFCCFIKPFTKTLKSEEDDDKLGQAYKAETRGRWPAWWIFFLRWVEMKPPTRKYGWPWFTQTAWMLNIWMGGFLEEWEEWEASLKMYYGTLVCPDPWISPNPAFTKNQNSRGPSQRDGQVSESWVLCGFSQFLTAIVMNFGWIKSSSTCDTLPETNSSPLKIGLPNRKVVFQPSIFRCEVLVSWRVKTLPISWDIPFAVARQKIMCAITLDAHNRDVQERYAALEIPE